MNSVKNVVSSLSFGEKLIHDIKLSSLSDRLISLNKINKLDVARDFVYLVYKIIR